MICTHPSKFRFVVADSIDSLGYGCIVCERRTPAVLEFAQDLSGVHFNPEEVPLKKGIWKEQKIIAVLLATTNDYLTKIIEQCLTGMS